MTPMQELIERINGNDFFKEDAKVTLKMMIEAMLEKEKQMIIDAYDKCDYNHNHLLIENQIDGEQYYKEILKQ